MRVSAICLALMLPWTVQATTSLETELKTLRLDDSSKNAPVPMERYYAAQSRYSSLKHRLELDIGGAKNFSPSSFVTSDEIHGDLRFYFTDRFYTGLHGAYVHTSLSAEGHRLWENDKIFPDVAVVKYRSDLTFGYHLFYGKFRVSMDSVFYFDQYWALGAGMVGTDNGLGQQSSVALVGDAGFALWFGRHWSVRLGLKDYNFQEPLRTGTSRVNHFVGHASLGFVFGGEGA